MARKMLTMIRKTKTWYTMKKMYAKMSLIRSISSKSYWPRQVRNMVAKASRGSMYAADSCPKMFMPASANPKIMTMRMAVNVERSPTPRATDSRRTRRLICRSK